MDRLNRKFDALQRVAQAIEEAGDPASLIPDPSQLIPVVNLDLTTYNNIRSNCPFLGLPAADIDHLTGLNDIRSKLSSAYSDLISDLEKHPWLRFDRLQGMLDRALSQATASLSEVQGYLQCATSICGASTSEEISRNQAIMEKYAQNFVDGPGTILTSSMVTKKNQVNTAISAIRALQ
jgi:hypothetical protein